MCIFAKQKLDIVRTKKLFYYKLYVDNVCQFDCFRNEIEVDKRRKKSLNGVYALMEGLECGMLPQKKFRHINESKHKDIFEFKKDDVRVYVLMQKPDICIVMGGYKADQKMDIKKIKALVKDIPPILEIKQYKYKQL